MIDLTQQRQAELVYHEHALRAEFNDWLQRADGPNQPFAKHQSQLTRITTLLNAFLDTVDAANVPADFSVQEERYGYLLGIYRIWSYFRSKLIARQERRLGDILRCADELAWACYQPARAAAASAGVIDVERLKEPPLVFFSSDATPFAQTRATAFMPEGLSDRDIANFDALVLSLPITVVGVPWFQLNHLPALPVVAHEVGHAVERDFGLAQPLTALFAALDVDGQRRVGWQAWRREIFADVYACLCIGPAYLLALIDYLAGDAEQVQKEERRPDSWSAYPTRTLRVLLNIKTLDRLGLLAHGSDLPGFTPALGDFLTGLRRSWTAAYPQHRMQPFEADIEKVVCGLLHARFAAFGDRPLREVVRYEQGQLLNSWHLSSDLLDNSSFPAAAQTWSFRDLAAAPALAYARNAPKYTAIKAQHSVLNAEQANDVKSLLAAIPSGVRAAGDDDDLSARQLAADRLAGRGLAAFFRRADVEDVTNGE